MGGVWGYPKTTPFSVLLSKSGLYLVQPVCIFNDPFDHYGHIGSGNGNRLHKFFKERPWGVCEIKLTEALVKIQLYNTVHVHVHVHRTGTA